MFRIHPEGRWRILWQLVNRARDDYLLEPTGSGISASRGVRAWVILRQALSIGLECKL